MRCPRICSRSSTGTPLPNPWRSIRFAAELHAKARKSWTDHGGELISLPGDEQAAMMKTLASVGEDVAKTKPQLYEAYKIVTDAAKRNSGSASEAQMSYRLCRSRRSANRERRQVRP